MMIWTRQEPQSGIEIGSDTAPAALVMPPTEDELRRATAALDASTRSIVQRTKILESQIATIKSSSAIAGTTRDREASHANYLSQRQAAEIQHVTFANEQLLDRLRTELLAEQDKLEREVKFTHSEIPRLLNSDDRILEDLNSLSAGRSTTPLDISQTKKRLEDLTTALHYFQVQKIKDHLDCTYLQSLEKSRDRNPSGEPTLETANDVQQDLGTLYSEIDDVVTMMIAQQYEKPITTALNHIETALEREGQATASKIHSQLSNLTTSLAQLATNLERLASHRHMIGDLVQRSQAMDSEHQPQPRPKSQRPNTHQLETLSPTTMTALLTHLNIPPDPTCTAAQLTKRIETQIARLQDRSSDAIAQAVAASRDAASRGASAVENVATALEKKAADGDHVRELEDAINHARAELERVLRDR